MEKLKPDATGIYVAAHQAPGAIEEAIEAEVPLIVAVAEHLPIHDIMRVGFQDSPKADLLNLVDPVDAQNTIKVKTSWRKLSWYNICHWKV